MKQLRSIRPRTLAVVAAALLARALPPAANAEHLPPDETFRRKLKFAPATSDAPGDNMAVAEFYLNGQQRPDLADLRVADASFAVVPFRILQCSPKNDHVRVAFVTRSVGPYYAWWGNPALDRAPPPCDVTRGVLCDVTTYNGHGVNSEDDIRACFAHPLHDEHDGSLFVPQIFLADNPLGPEDRAQFRYTAQFKIDRRQDYHFAFDVDDTGLVAVDGKTLLTKTGGGNMTGDARRHKVINLAAGWHKMEVLQINSGGQNTGVTLGWRFANEHEFTIPPASIYAPLAVASPGPIENMGKPYAASFAVEPQAELFLPPTYYCQRYAFEATFPETWSPSLLWDFGDGQTATDARPSHVFLAPGIYPVTLTLKQGANRFATTERVEVQDRMYGKFPDPPADASNTVALILQKYDIKKLPGHDLLRGMLFFKAYDRWEGRADWGLAWLKTNDREDEWLVVEETDALARYFIAHDKFKEAADCYRLAAFKPLSPQVRARMLRRYLITQSDFQNDPAPAIALARERLEHDPAMRDPNLKRALLAGLAYASIAQGNGKSAEQYVADAGEKNESIERSEIDQGVFARNVETYIKSDWIAASDLLDKWELDHPPAITLGFTRLLRFKLLMAENHAPAAAHLAAQFVAAEPQSFYAAELLYNAAKAFHVANTPELAARTMETLRKNYPESPYARDAQPTP